MRRRAPIRAHLRRWASLFVTAAHMSAPHSSHLARLASGPFSAPCAAGNLKVQLPWTWTLLSGLTSRLRPAFAGASLVALLVLPGAAPAQQPAELGIAFPDDSAGNDRRAAVAALERWDVPGAREAVERLGDSREPENVLLRSRLAFHAGEYAEAVRLLGLLPPAVASLEPVGAYARLAAASLAMDGRLAAIESEHFVLRFDPERDWVLAEPALEALESGYEATARWLGERTPL